MTAKTIREQAEIFNKEKSSSIITEIENLINLNAKIGYFDCFYYGSFDTIAFEHFKSLGFKIEEDYNPKD